jgi:hypothetical protein
MCIFADYKLKLDSAVLSKDGQSSDAMLGPFINCFHIQYLAKVQGTLKRSVNAKIADSDA